MDIGLMMARLREGRSVVRCPNCRRIYDPMREVEDWGVTIGSEDGGDTSFDICGNCVTNPQSIDLKRVRSEHEKRGTPDIEIKQGIDKLRLLKEGKVKPEEIVG